MRHVDKAQELTQKGLVLHQCGMTAKINRDRKTKKSIEGQNTETDMTRKALTKNE